VGLGPTERGGTCVSKCGPGTTRCAYVGCPEICPLCEPGTFKGVLGPQPCTPCAAPRNTSRAGAIADTDCSCRAGQLDLADLQVEQVLAVGERTDPSSANVSGDSTDERCWSSVTAASIPDGVAALTIQVLRHSGTLVLFECTSAADCAVSTTWGRGCASG
jgi:hypothetical protein